MDKKLFRQAKKYLPQVKKAGARHSISDNRMLQDIHDMVCKLGAKCPEYSMGSESRLNGKI